MSTATDPRLRLIAQECVENMGDIFWDYDSKRDKLGDYTDPYNVAIVEVEKSLQQFSDRFDTNMIYPRTIREDYATIVAALELEPGEDALIRALVEQADWTKEGAQAVFNLAQQYGTSVLRNALALAEALGIEDGSAGL